MTLAENYARALHEAASEKGKTSRELFANFVAGLKRRGHEKLLSRIEAEYQKLLVRDGKNIFHVTIASEKDRAGAVAHLKEKMPEGVEKEDFEMCEDSNLIAGYSIAGPDFRYDASAKRSLIELYKRLTAA